MFDHSAEFIGAVALVASRIDARKIDDMAIEIERVRKHGGRLFILGVGGGAANASHAVNDFRKLCGVEAYAPTDNVAELTARINDDGWHRCFEDWLLTSNLSRDDLLLIFSVGGGSKEVSSCIMGAVSFARDVGARVLGIVGKADGFTAMSGNCVIVVPQMPDQWITPLTETFQIAILHCLVNHPLLNAAAMLRDKFREFGEAETTEGA